MTLFNKQLDIGGKFQNVVRAKTSFPYDISFYTDELAQSAIVESHPPCASAAALAGVTHPANPRRPQQAKNPPPLRCPPV